uniref:KIAA1324 like n=1 Tax=Pavo cristatus TaxID=9049 RepID=A0A8C9FJJ3_PAVCR
MILTCKCCDETETLCNCLQTDYHFEYTECDSSGSRWRVAVPNPSAECSGLPDPVKGKECTFSCASGEYLEMKNQVCSKCAEGTYSLGSGIKFDEWDELPAGFSNVATFMDTAVGSVTLKSGSNILYWRTTGILMGSKVVKPVLVKNITIEGVAYTSECFPCKPGTYSDKPGSSGCQECPRNTYSEKGAKECTKCKEEIYYAEEGSSACIERPPCTNKDFFQIHTPCDKEGKVSKKPDIINNVIELQASIVRIDCRVSGEHLVNVSFLLSNRPPTSVTGATGSELGRITFVFETICSADCVLYFMADINRKNTNVVESWERSKEKQSYTHIISKNASFTFTWAFQRINEGQDSRQFINDVAKIYSITVTNAVDGVASSCRACALGSEQSGSSCVPCPVGHYIEKETSQCKECPANTFLSIHQVYGREACIPCGPGSKSTKGKKMAICTDNITDVTLKDMVAESEDFSNFVGAFVCQSTIIPSDSKGFRTALALQSNSLADRFLGTWFVFCILLNITDHAFFFLFHIRSSTTTTSCEDGRATVVTVRCNPNKPDQGELSVPSSCPAGTCDGCTFYFVWESAEACPLCTEQDYHEIEGACKKGFQETLYVWNEPKHCIKGVPLPEKRTSTCETVDFWLKVGAGVGAFAAVLLIALTCYFWKKNQKLEYKYSKLVMTANSKECELPAADSCAIMEGEDNEEEIVYSNKQSLLGKLKSLATKVSGN